MNNNFFCAICGSSRTDLIFTVIDGKMICHECFRVYARSKEVQK